MRFAKFVKPLFAGFLCLLLSATVVELYPVKTPAVRHIPALRLVRENIVELLRRRHMTQKDLAVWCGHEEAWISAILREHRGLPMQELDRVADFFGLEPHELLRPGIAIERRSGLDRRVGERRIGPTRRTMVELATQAQPTNTGQGSHGAASIAALKRETAAFMRRIHTALSEADTRRQITAARDPIAALHPRRGIRRGRTARHDKES